MRIEHAMSYSNLSTDKERKQYLRHLKQPARYVKRCCLHHVISKPIRTPQIYYNLLIFANYVDLVLRYTEARSVRHPARAAQRTSFTSSKQSSSAEESNYNTSSYLDHCVLVVNLRYLSIWFYHLFTIFARERFSHFTLASTSTPFFIE